MFELARNYTGNPLMRICRFQHYYFFALLIDGLLGRLIQVEIFFVNIINAFERLPDTDGEAQRTNAYLQLAFEFVEQVERGFCPHGPSY